MAKQPPKSDDEIAKAALDDIQGNIHVLKTLAEYDQRYVLQRILRAIREAKGAVVLTLCILPFAAHAGTVTCAGKSYKDITYAMFYGLGGFGVVSLWQGVVRDETAIKRAAPKYVIILNAEMTCELEDLQLHHMGE
jgi:hypothetical protein